MADGTALWVYAITHRLPAERVGGLTGVASSAAQIVDAAGLSAVVSPVDLAEFGEQALRSKLEDLDWLEHTARAHHGVIHAVATLAPVVPMRLATVYRGQAGLTAMMTRRAPAIEATLRWLIGRKELGIKVYAARGAGAGEPAGHSPVQAAAAAGPGRPGGAAPGAGAAYLRMRRAELSAREDNRREALDSAGRLHSALSALAISARLHQPQHPRLAGKTAPMMLNAAYLVEEERCPAFETAAAELAAASPAVSVELTGPWPPYSFATVPDLAGATA
jgi:hypothetical protein